MGLEGFYGILALNLIPSSNLLEGVGSMTWPVFKTRLQKNPFYFIFTGDRLPIRKITANFDDASW
jgi:hypothetical protein